MGRSGQTRDNEGHWDSYSPVLAAHLATGLALMHGHVGRAEAVQRPTSSLRLLIIHVPTMGNATE